MLLRHRLAIDEVKGVRSFVLSCRLKMIEELVDSEELYLKRLQVIRDVRCHTVYVFLVGFA